MTISAGSTRVVRGAVQQPTNALRNVYTCFGLRAQRQSALRLPFAIGWATHEVMATCQWMHYILRQSVHAVHAIMAHLDAMQASLDAMQQP